MVLCILPRTGVVMRKYAGGSEEMRGDARTCAEVDSFATRSAARAKAILDVVAPPTLFPGFYRHSAAVQKSSKPQIRPATYTPILRNAVGGRPARSRSLPRPDFEISTFYSRPPSRQSISESLEAMETSETCSPVQAGRATRASLIILGSSGEGLTISGGRGLGFCAFRPH